MSFTNQDVLAYIIPTLTALCAVVAALTVTPLWDKLAMWYTGDITKQLYGLGVNEIQINYFLRAWGVALFVVFMIFIFVIGMPLIGAVLVTLILLLPRTYGRSAVIRKRIRYRDQLVAACMNIANASRAGFNLEKSIETIIPLTPAPLSFEFQKIISETNAGRPFEDAMRASQKRLQLESMTLFVLASLSCKKKGADLTDALDRIALSLLENQRLQRLRESQTASGSRVIQVLSIVPFGFLGLSFLLDPEGASLVFTTFIGNIIIAASIVLIYISRKWASAILGLDSTSN